MKTDIPNRWENITRAAVLLVLVAGVMITPYAFTVSEPAKVIMFGAVLVGLAL